VHLVKAYTAEWVLLSVHLPSEQGRPAGILILDCASNQLHMEMLPTLVEDKGEDFTELWPAIREDLHERGNEMGGRQLLEWLEASVSHFIRISDRETITVCDFPEELKLLYGTYVSGGSHSSATSNSNPR